MQFKAIQTLILWHDGQMKVFNPGDKGDLPESVILPEIKSKKAEAIKGKVNAKAAAEGDSQDAPAGAEVTGDDAPAGDPQADPDAPPA